MVTRKSLTILAGLTLVLFAVTGILGNNHHGALRVVADIAWWGFILAALFLIIASVATLLRHRSHPNRS